MNLHDIVRGPINAVNPDTLITFKLSLGATGSPSGRQTPNYQEFDNVGAQIQAFDGDALMHTEKLAIQGVYRQVYMYGNSQGIVRPNQKGGDLLLFPQTPGDPVQTWLVVRVKETWPDWSRVIVCLQQ